jgi:uncharacterized protein (DUF1778 family)
MWGVNVMLRKQQRLEARVTRAQKRLIERAARLRGTSVTDFVVASAEEAAAAAIKDSESLNLHDQAREVFITALLNPPAPNSAAQAATRRYHERIKV